MRLSLKEATISSYMALIKEDDQLLRFD